MTCSANIVKSSKQGQTNGGARTRRVAGAKNIASKYARTDIRKESFAIRVVGTWNRLPDSVKLTEKPESFKKELKKTKA